MFDPIKTITEYTAFPSVSTDPAYADGMTGARNYISGKLEALGFEIEIVETPKHPVILAERGADHEDWPHLMIYSHYDVQPADPFDLWRSEPFKAEVRGDRLYGRGAADNKGPTVVQLCALAQALDEQPDLPLRITWLIEGEEEIGSPSIPEFLKNYADRLSKADFIVLSDTGCPNPDQPAITTGLRGMIPLEIFLTGPSHDLHSGISGGAVMNPLRALSNICASLHNEDGTVNVPGFYDAVVDIQEWEREELAKLPTTEEQLKETLGVPAFDCPPGLSPFEATRVAPTLEFNGMGGGYMAEGEKTIIPSKAFAKITCRLVPNQDPKVIQKAVEAAILERCPKSVSVKVALGAGAGPYMVTPPGRSNTPADQSPVLNKAFSIVDSAMKEVWGVAPIYLREGGSVPIIKLLKEATGCDSLMMGLFTTEDRLHSPNESFHLKIMERGIQTYKHLFTELAK